MSASDHLIQVKGIRREFQLDGLFVPVLNGVNLTIRKGELVALMGASGSGKTTLMNILGCLDHPSAGTYRLDGEEISNLSSVQLAHIRRERIGFVFQTFNLLPRTSALENVLMPAIYFQNTETWGKTLSRARELLCSVGLGSRHNHIPAQLSGGEQQRVAIARALINRPQLLLADEPTGNLDSQTGRDILALFRRLNRDHGITILLVTHDPNVAANADRVIRVADGVILGDELETIVTYKDPCPQWISTPPARQTNNSEPALKSARTDLWQLLALIRMALATLSRNLMRSTLTLLGIVIGVAAVITLMEISAGASTAIQLTVANMGVSNLVVSPVSREPDGFSRKINKPLSSEDARAIGDNILGVASVAPIIHTRGQVVYGDRNWFTRNVIGTTPEFLAVRDWEILALGNKFHEQDVAVGTQVCLIGQTLAKKLFGESYPVGQDLRVNNIPMRVIGVLSSKGSSLLGADQDDILIAPLKTVRDRFQGHTIGSDKGVKVADIYRNRPSHQRASAYRSEEVNYILVHLTGPDKLASTAQEIQNFLRARHQLGENEDDFSIHDNAELSRAFNRTVELLSSLGMAVAIVSLLVGGIGIMNIMLVSVTERTKEIGIRLAVGATPANIRNQFLIESIILCLIGGALGILAGRTGSQFTGNLLGWPVEVSTQAAMIAVFVSITVGILFGIYPAWKASRLDPIQSLRFE